MATSSHILAFIQGYSHHLLLLQFHSLYLPIFWHSFCITALNSLSDLIFGISWPSVAKNLYDHFFMLGGFLL